MTQPDFITVKHHLGTYKVIIQPEGLETIGSKLKDRGLKGPVGLISNKIVNDLYGDSVRESIQNAGFKTRTILVPDGEQYKTLATAEQVMSALIEQDMEREGTIISLGGGVIGDIAGFISAILFRGVSLVHIPTTLLAMVDASVGGKTAVNHPLGKNLIGAFHQPQLVLIDPLVLKTIGNRDRLSGLAEMLKMGFIQDEDYLDSLTAHMSKIMDLENLEILSHTIARSCQLKAAIVSYDEREQDLRRILNFGHTLGHAIERQLGYGRIRHGEAVILGMYGAGWLSNQLGDFPEPEWEKMKKILLQTPLTVSVDELDADQILHATRTDKKVKQNKVNYILLKKIGVPVIRDNIPPVMVKLAGEAIKTAWKKE